MNQKSFLETRIWKHALFVCLIVLVCSLPILFWARLFSAQDKSANDLRINQISKFHSSQVVSTEELKGGLVRVVLQDHEGVPVIGLSSKQQGLAVGDQVVVFLVHTRTHGGGISFLALEKKP